MTISVCCRGSCPRRPAAGSPSGTLGWRTGRYRKDRACPTHCSDGYRRLSRREGTLLHRIRQASWVRPDTGAAGRKTAWSARPSQNRPCRFGEPPYADASNRSRACCGASRNRPHWIIQKLYHNYPQNLRFTYLYSTISSNSFLGLLSGASSAKPSAKTAFRLAFF